MTETVTLPTAATAPAQGLLARAVGVIFSPRATYQNVVAHPKVLGALVVTIGIMAGALGAFLSTDVGSEAFLDQQIRQRESLGRPMSEAETAQMQRILPYLKYALPVFQPVGIVIVVFIVSGIMFGVFNAFLGGDAAFKQVLAIVVHSGFVFALQQFFVLPLDYVKESLTSPTTLAALLPFLDEMSFAARFLGALDLFLIWWIVNLAIGLGVLYKRRTGPVATGLLVTYTVIALVIAAVRTAFSGA